MFFASKFFRFFGISLLTTFAFVGCATRPQYAGDVTAEKLLQYACAPGKTVQEAQGSIAIKAYSKEIKGQFGASVKVQAPGQLNLEITNFLGGAEAILSVDHERYRVTSADGKEQREEGYESWGGIPLHWAVELFLGRIPCPSLGKPGHQVSQTVTADGRLIVLDSIGNLKTGDATSEKIQEEFIFSFKKIQGEPWPSELQWTKTTPSQPKLVVNFYFADPDKKTQSPHRWEAQSARGSIKVRWRDREIVENPGIQRSAPGINALNALTHRLASYTYGNWGQMR